MQRPTTVTGNSDAGKIGNIYIYGTTTNFGITTMHDDFDDFDNDRHPEMELQRLDAVSSPGHLQVTR